MGRIGEFHCRADGTVIEKDETGQVTLNPALPEQSVVFLRRLQPFGMV